MEQVGLIVLGAVLALMTSVVVEFVKIWLNDRRTKKQFRNFIKMDIPSMQASIDRLVQDTAKLGFIPVIILNELDAIRQGYDRLRHWVILFKEDKFQRDLIDYYKRLHSTTVQANLLESQVAHPQHASFVQSQRTVLVAEFRDIATRGRDLLQRIDIQ